MLTSRMTVINDSVEKIFMFQDDDEYQNPEYLVNTDWLENHLDDADLRIFDCTVNVTSNTDLEQAKKMPFLYRSGRIDFDKAHIPGAGFISVPLELSDISSSIPLMLPPEEQFVNVMRSHGINDDSHVVLYSSSETNWAARVWWILKSFGFDNVAILNGGFSKWTMEERPISDQACNYEYGELTTRHRPDAFVSKDEVLSAVNDDGVCIINALPSLIHTGESNVTFGRKGRIKGSVNVPFVSLHDPETGIYLSASLLRKQFDEVHVSEAEKIITYCGGGVAASNNAFVLSLLGYENVAVYDGSMLEWGNDESLPMEIGK